MGRFVFRLVLVVSGAVGLGLSVRAQSPASQAPPPTFRSTVDFLTIEASVRDRRGVPATELQAADFVVTIDRRPRNTASVAMEAGGPPLARISRVIEIAPAPPVAEAETAPVPRPIPPSPVPAGSPADEVMRRVGGYVERYGGEAALLVAVEDYAQSVTVTKVQGGGISPRLTDVMGDKRRLVSEFVLVPNRSASGGWLGYRDVMEVDGKAVADRRDRLQALFRSDTPDLEAARRIAEESARYNIGPVSRNFNLPTATLFFFHPGNLPRFTFRQKGTERVEGVDAATVEFRETRTPTLIMNAAGKDVPASGTLWINPADGAVVRTRIQLDGFHGSGSHAAILVTYRKDAALGMWVPSRMEEQYSGGASGATTVATYKDFRRFQTSAKIK